MRFLAVAILSLVTLGACGGRGSVPRDQAATPTLDELEQALLEAQVWQADVHITATGTFAVDMTASVLATRDNRVRLDARGTFAGEPHEVRWVSDGARTSAGAAAPPHTTEALAIGMTRMGVLHNVARLVLAGAPPDHADGGVRDWVVANDVRTTAPGELAFGLTVAGEPSGEATVSTAPTPHGPVMTRRTTTVHFDAGDMAVEETYTFDLAVVLPSVSFVVGDGS